MVTCFQQALTAGRGLHLKNTVRGFLGPGIRGFYLWQNAPHFLTQILGRRGRASKVTSNARQALRLAAWTQGPQERLPAGSLLPHPILGPVDLMALPVPCFLFLRELRIQNPPDPTMFSLSTLQLQALLPLTRARPQALSLLDPALPELHVAQPGPPHRWRRDFSIGLGAGEGEGELLPPVLEPGLSEPACRHRPSV